MLPNLLIDTVPYWMTGVLCVCVCVIYVKLYCCGIAYTYIKCNSTVTLLSCRTAYAKGMGHSEAHDMVTMTEFQVVRETIW